MSKTLLVKNKDGKDLGDYNVPENLLEYDKGDHAVHEVVVAYQAHQRAGTASTLSKSKVAGSGKKPWKQKGLGRARAGYKQSPIWRGGAVAHGPHPRSYKKKISKKIAKLAFRRAFSEKIQQNEVILIEDLNLESPKTKELNKIYKNLGIERGCLMVVDEVSQNLFLSSRNIQNVELISADLLNTYKLLLYKTVVVTKAAMNVLEKRLSKESD
ncbi:MAG: 50S ribosomal protein L4 [Verrucomicrobiota bacterium]|nr:50S ribosomal protein L4 [Verrucomicrobiota bacterium]